MYKFIYLCLNKNVKATVIVFPNPLTVLVHVWYNTYWSLLTTITSLPLTLIQGHRLSISMFKICLEVSKAS